MGDGVTRGRQRSAQPHDRPAPPGPHPGAPPTLAPAPPPPPRPRRRAVPAWRLGAWRWPGCPTVWRRSSLKSTRPGVAGRPGQQASGGRWAVPAHGICAGRPRQHCLAPSQEASPPARGPQPPPARGTHHTEHDAQQQGGGHHQKLAHLRGARQALRRSGSAATAAVRARRRKQWRRQGRPRACSGGRSVAAPGCLLAAAHRPAEAHGAGALAAAPQVPEEVSGSQVLGGQGRGQRRAGGRDGQARGRRLARQAGACARLRCPRLPPLAPVRPRWRQRRPPRPSRSCE